MLVLKDLERTVALSVLRSSTALTSSASGAAATTATATIMSSGASAATVTTALRSSDPFANGVLSGYKWAATSLSYSMPTQASHYEYTGEVQNGFSSVNAAQQAAIRKALEMYSSVAAIDLVETTETASMHADMRFANSGRPPTAWAYMPSDSPQGGDVWFNGSNASYLSPDVGDYGFHTVLHEIGHAIGLKHAHEKSGTFGVMSLTHQSMEYTVMSYSSYIGASTTSGYTNQVDSFAQSLMMDDIAAVQSMYGANYDTHAENTTYMWDPNSGSMTVNGVVESDPTANRIFLTVWDGGGEDTYDFASYATALSVNLTPGAWTTTSADQLADLHYNGSRNAVGNIANARLFNKDVRSYIENAIGGAGNDKIIGNAAANRLTGGAGDDRLEGGVGTDILIGGAGADYLSGGSGIDTVDFSADGEAVALSLATGGSGGSAMGDKYAGIERVIGTAYGDIIAGGSLSETIDGGLGNDVLSGGAGNDVLNGGDGDDVLSGGTGYDVLTGGAGADTFKFNLATEIGKVVKLRDIIADFTAGQDMIDLSGIDANTGVTGNQEFTLLATGAAFTGAGQLRVRYETTASGERTIVEGNVNSTVAADFQIELSGRIEGLTTSSFVL